MKVNFELMSILLAIFLFSSRNRHKSDLSSADGRKQILVLGAGMVCAPLVEYLYRDESLSINVCSEFKEQADQLANQFPGIKSTYLNIMENPSHLTELCGIFTKIFMLNIYLYLSIKVKLIFCMENP